MKSILLATQIAIQIAIQIAAEQHLDPKKSQDLLIISYTYDIIYEVSAMISYMISYYEIANTFHVQYIDNHI